jgi:hypothetical protein
VAVADTAGSALDDATVRDVLDQLRR